MYISTSLVFVKIPKCLQMYTLINSTVCPVVFPISLKNITVYNLWDICIYYTTIRPCYSQTSHKQPQNVKKSGRLGCVCLQGAVAQGVFHRKQSVWTLKCVMLDRLTRASPGKAATSHNVIFSVRLRVTQHISSFHCCTSINIGLR